MMITLTEILGYIVAILLFGITARRTLGWARCKFMLRRSPVFLKTGSATLHHALHEMSCKTGDDVLGISFYGHNSVVLSSFEVMKAILGNQYLAGDRPCPVSGNLSPPLGAGVIRGSGHCWKILKSQTKQQLRHICANKKLMDSLIQKEIDKIICKVPMSTTASQMITLDLRDLDLYSSFHRLLWGILVGPLDDSAEMRNIINYYNTQFKEPAENADEDWYSYPTWLFNMDQHILQEGYVEAIRQLVQEKTRKNDSNEDSGGLINSLLKNLLNRGANDSTDKEKYTVEQITATVSDICSTGTQPMAHAVKWMIYLLAKNPHVQCRILQEIKEDEANPKGRTSKKMFRKATLFEVFRVGNVLPIPIPRCATATFSINGFVVQKGCSIMYNLEHVFKDRDYWGENVDAFSPERFLDPSGTKLVKTERMVVFGFGKRACLGDSVVWVTLMKYLTVICKNLELSRFQSGSGATKSKTSCCLNDNLIYARRR